jgi:hypothetical protein
LSTFCHHFVIFFIIFLIILNTHNQVSYLLSQIYDFL